MSAIFDIKSSLNQLIGYTTKIKQDLLILIKVKTIVLLNNTGPNINGINISFIHSKYVKY